MQDEQLTTIERAFVLARGGRFASIKSIRKQLRLEGYAEKSQLQGPMLYSQLRLLISTQKSAVAAEKEIAIEAEDGRFEFCTRAGTE
jgi:hypothetical protein